MSDGPEAAAPDAADRAQLFAHDIRSAVADVIGGIRLIDRGTLPGEAAAQVDRARAAAELLARLVDAALEDAPPEGDRAVGNLDLGRFLDDEIRRWHGAASGTGTRVTLERGSDVPEIVRLDRLHLRRIVANLMGNAMRAAEGGRILLRASLLADDALELCVCDDGPGFPEDALPDLRGEAVEAVPSGQGRGMGLRIASSHAKAIGGVLAARNRSTGGAHLTLTVPASVWRRKSGSEPERDLTDLSGVRVLVADDSATIRTLMRGMLTRLGAECETAVDGIDALNWLARERFDLALLDIEMPVLGGMEVLRAERLRQARGIAPPTAMMAMTSHGSRDTQMVIAEAGADAILTKPLGSIEVVGRSLRAVLERSPDPAGWVPDAAPPLSGATLVELMGAAGPEYHEQLIARLREDVATAERMLGEASDAEDREGLATQAHVLLSLCGAIGALPVQEAARALDRALRDGDDPAVAPAARACLARLPALRAELDLVG